MEKHFHAVGNRFHSGNDFTVEKRPLYSLFILPDVYKKGKVFIHIFTANFEKRVVLLKLRRFEV